MAFHFILSDRIKKLRLDIKKYEPPVWNRKSVLTIGIFGNTGAGKSSVINSFLSIFMVGKYNTYAQTAAPICSTGMTAFRSPFKLTDRIQIIDNRGLDDLRNEKTIDEVEAQLDGRRGYGTEVNQYISSAESEVTGEDVHIAILVVKGSQEHGADLVNEGIELIKRMVICQGRAPFAIITHIDVAKPQSLSETHRYLEAIGICPTDIFEIENAMPDKWHLKDKHKLMLLELLQRCTNDAKHTMRHKADRRREMAEIEARKATNWNGSRTQPPQVNHPTPTIRNEKSVMKGK